MGDFFFDSAASGSIVLALPIALLAGLISFFSPCVIPLLPGYLSYATGLSGADLATGDLSGVRRGRMLVGSVLFVLGFSVVFVALGTTVGALGSLGEQLVLHRDTLTLVLGFVVIAMGLVFLGAVPFLQRDVRVHAVPAVGLAAAPVLGFLFGLGWTPCLGPTLTAITALSLQEGTAGRGAVLAGAYALGLGLPFLLAGLAYRRALGLFSAVRRHQAWVTRAGGVMLVLVGLAMVTCWWDWAVQWLQLQVIGRVETVA